MIPYVLFCYLTILNIPTVSREKQPSTPFSNIRVEKNSKTSWRGSPSNVQQLATVSFLKQLEKNILTVFSTISGEAMRMKAVEAFEKQQPVDPKHGCGRFWLSWPGVLSSNPAVCLAREHKNKPIMCLGPAHQNISRIRIWQFYNFVPLLGSQDEFCFANFQA